MKRYNVIPPSQQRVGGYLGNWMKKNITHELLEFPIEEYLLPYYTTGLMIKHWSGEDFLGKYFQGLIYAYQYADKIMPDGCMLRMIKNRMDQIVHALLHYYQKNEDNVILYMTDPPGEFDEEWRLFTVKYGLLILLGYHELFHEEKTLEAAKKIGEKMIEEYDEENGKPINVEGRTAIEGFAELYRLTGERKYLEFCHYIMKARVCKEFVTDVLKYQGELYRIPECHAYTVLATYLGILDLVEQDEKCPQEYLEACKVAIEDIVNKRMNVVGGTSTGEHFKPDGILGGTPCDRINEACANAYFMRVCLKLFWITGEVKYIDYVERTLYNVGLGCKNPRDTFLTSYFTPLQGFHLWKKIHLTTGTPCCPASMSREIARITDMIWAKSDHEIWVLLYNESEMETDIAEKNSRVNVKLQMHTEFPHNGRVMIEVSAEKTVNFELCLRIPEWCRKFAVTLSDGQVLDGRDKKVIRINKAWGNGEKLQIIMDLTVRLVDGGEGFPGYKAIARGPQIMAVDARVNKIDELDGLRMDIDKPCELNEASKEILPIGWCGKQVYMSPMINKIYFTPFAHTGQMKAGDRYRTYIRTADDWKIVNDTECAYEGDGWKETFLSIDDYLFVPYHGNRPLDWLDDKCRDSSYGGTIHQTEQSGDAVHYSFYGSELEVYGCIPDFKDRKLSVPFIADLFIDELEPIRIHVTEYQMQKRVFVKNDLKEGNHTVRLVCRGSMILDYLRYR